MEDRGHAPMLHRLGHELGGTSAVAMDKPVLGINPLCVAADHTTPVVPSRWNPSSVLTAAIKPKQLLSTRGSTWE